MLIVLLYMSMISVGSYKFDGAKRNLAQQIIILP